MVTYGDTMTLLLCFFVIIVSMSEIKKDQWFDITHRDRQHADAPHAVSLQFIGDGLGSCVGKISHVFVDRILR